MIFVSHNGDVTLKSNRNKEFVQKYEAAMHSSDFILRLWCLPGFPFLIRCESPRDKT